MLLIFSNFRIAELGIAWRTCEMDRILCHKAVALMDALELGACLKGSLALLIFGTFSIFSFQKTYRYTDHTQIISFSPQGLDQTCAGSKFPTERMTTPTSSPEHIEYVFPKYMKSTDFQ